MNDHEDDESSASGDEIEGLEFLLGGLSVEAFSPDAWENESHHEDDDATAEESVTATMTPTSTRKKKIPPTQYKVRPHHQNDDDDAETDLIFRNAYTCSGSCAPNGRVQRPPVQVADLSMAGRGSALIATTAIPKGQVIYTERAAIATQVPGKDNEQHGNNVGFSVPACQHCFRSLAGASLCQAPNAPAMPMPHLWPIPDLLLDVTSTTDALHQKDEIQKDKHGRVKCTCCQALFCSEHCRSQQVNAFGSCCVRTRALHMLPTVLQTDSEVQSAVALAVCMFGMGLQRYRQTGSLKGTGVDGLCGNDTEVTALELGAVERNANGNVQYTLEPVYNELLNIFSMTPTEQAVLSLKELHCMAAKAARNGVGIRTQSPFKAYHAALVRQGGGRGSSKQVELTAQVAAALGSTTGKLERGMDRVVEERVAPEIVALFPLTARINHSCAPNTEIRSQEFVDCHMDLVAVCDIGAGQEILISYIGVGPAVGRKSGPRRRRELQAKYLFQCDCEECKG